MTISVSRSLLFLFLTQLAVDATLAANPGGKTAAAIDLFNGKDLTGWKTKDGATPDKWVVGRPSMSKDNQRELVIEPIVLCATCSEAKAHTHGKGEACEVCRKAAKCDKCKGALISLHGPGNRGQDIVSEVEHGDCRLEFEVMIPRASNSGFYVMGQYEIQIFDSHGRRRLGKDDMGAIWGFRPPDANGSKPAGQWQKFVIDFAAPKYGADGRMTSGGKFVRVELNGKVIHENVMHPHGTMGRLKNRAPETGPPMLQGGFGPVAFRNIKITPK